MKHDIEHNALKVIRSLGWVNFIFLALNFMSSKGAGSHQIIMLWSSLALCFVGTIVYYLLYGYIFTTVSKEKAVKYFKPYRLGTLLFVCAFLVPIALHVFTFL